MRVVELEGGSRKEERKWSSGEENRLRMGSGRIKREGGRESSGVKGTEEEVRKGKAWKEEREREGRGNGVLGC